MCDIQVSEGDVDAPALASSLNPKLRLYFILMTAEQPNVPHRIDRVIGNPPYSLGQV
jgi:hypothetical protein